jgi:DNA-directed RNA polymerase subunit RPC12/RpoP
MDTNINDQTRVVYICGSKDIALTIECGRDVMLQPTDPVKCMCGYRILNKKRKVDLKNPP